MIKHKMSDFKFHPEFVSHVVDLVTTQLAEVRAKGVTVEEEDQTVVDSLLNTLRDVFFLERNSAITRLQYDFREDAEPEDVEEAKIIYTAIATCCGGAVRNPIVLYYLLTQCQLPQTAGAKAILDVRKTAHLTHW